MPIIAGIGVPSGNQTINTIVRALALGQIKVASARKLFAKEIGVSFINGLIWGSVVVFAFLISAMAAWAGVTERWCLNFAARRNGCHDSAVDEAGPRSGRVRPVTAITDSGGFFIFLGLATIFLV
jgi:magnesium transporter